MTELQQKNFEHAERELSAASSHVVKLEAEERDQQSLLESVQRRLHGIQRDLSAARLKEQRSITRLSYAVQDIVPAVSIGKPKVFLDPELHCGSGSGRAVDALRRANPSIEFVTGVPEGVSASVPFNR